MTTDAKVKVAVVTGGSRGLGRATSERLAQDGFFVALTYRSAEAEAAEVVRGIEAAGGRALAVRAELDSVAGVNAFFAALDAALEGALGERGIDVLVANAGAILDATLAQTTEEGFDQMFNLNVKGVFFTIQRAAERLRDGGRVINLGTGLTRFAYPNYIAYSAAKGAIDVLTRVLAAELGPRKITVNTVAPGAIDTDMNPWLKTEQGIAAMSGMAALGRVGHAEDIADVISFVASDDSRWVTAQRIEVSGGVKL